MAPVAVTPYVPRLLDATLEALLAALPAVMVVGPRGCGKTTSARRLVRSVVRLDREREAAPFRDDPDDLLRSLEPPVLLDEWQLVPGILAAVKRAVDDHVDGASYVLTGSVRAELLEASWAATGRVVRLIQWGLSERELAGRADAPSFFDVLFDGDIDDLRMPAEPPTLRDYVDLALRGTYPDVALQPSASIRRRWLAAYVDQLVIRDASRADEQRDPVRLRRYLVAVASNTAGVVEHKTIFDAAGVSRMTGVAYDSVLDLLFVAAQVPAWHSNRLNRLTRSPKRYLTDAALVGPLLSVDARAVLRDGDLLGRVVDTFVLSQLRPEAEASDRSILFSHLRLDRGEHEVDLIAEAADGTVVAIEIKSAAAPTLDDAVHLRWLRDRLGDQFRAGVLLHTGPRPFRLDERIHALPIATIWGPRRAV